MAGGMGRPRPDAESLADRVANTRARQQAEQPPPVKRCWYHGPDGAQPALLLRWRRITPDAPWEGHIAVARPHPDGGWALTEMWVGAAMLTPADAPPRP